MLLTDLSDLIAYLLADEHGSTNRIDRIVHMQPPNSKNYIPRSREKTIQDARKTEVSKLHPWVWI